MQIHNKSEKNTPQTLVFKPSVLSFTCNFHPLYKCIPFCVALNLFVFRWLHSFAAVTVNSTILLIWTIFPIRCDIIYIPKPNLFSQTDVRIDFHKRCVFGCCVCTEMMASSCLAARHWQISFHFILEFRFRYRTIFLPNFVNLWILLHLHVGLQRDVILCFKWNCFQRHTFDSIQLICSQILKIES